MAFKTAFSFFVLFISFLSNGVGQQSLYFPEKNNWETISVDEAGYNAALLDSAMVFSFTHEYSGAIDLKQAIYKSFEREPFHEIKGPTRDRGLPAGIILHNGKILKKWGDVDRVDMSFSVTKSYLSAVCGIAYDQNLLQVDDKLDQYIWDGYFQGRHNSKITWEHLLTQSSDWSGEIFGQKDWADRPPKDGDIDDWKNRELEEPGTFFEYNDVRINLLSYSLLNVIRKPLPQVLKESIMDPIGASTNWKWFGYEDSWVNVDGVKVQSVSGGGHSGGGIFMSTFDHARFGLLFSNDGKWKEKQLISKKWIEMSTKPSIPNPNYGYLWWLNSKEGDRYMEDVDENVFYASGFGGNFIIIDKTKNLVIVVRWLEPKYLNDFIKIIYSAKN